MTGLFFTRFLQALLSREAVMNHCEQLFLKGNGYVLQGQLCLSEVGIQGAVIQDII